MVPRKLSLPFPVRYPSPGPGQALEQTFVTTIVQGEMIPKVVQVPG